MIASLNTSLLNVSGGLIVCSFNHLFLSYDMCYVSGMTLIQSSEQSNKESCANFCFFSEK